MKFLYSSSTLWSIISTIRKVPRLDVDVWNRLKAAGIAKSTSRRGCRAGRNKQRSISTVSGYGLHSSSYLGLSTNCISWQIYSKFGNVFSSGSMQIMATSFEGYYQDNASLTPRDVHQLLPDCSQISTNIPVLLNNVNTRNLTYIKAASPLVDTTGSLCLDFSLINSRSICNKSRLIQDFIADNDIDILAVTETWLRGDDYDNYPVRDACPIGYSLYHTPRMNMRGGGVGVVLRNTFNVTNHTNAGSYQLFEYIELFLKLSTAPVRLVVLYRPPGANISAFCDEFANYLEYLSISPGYLLLVGDFNIHVDCFEDDNAVKFLNLLDSFNMTQHVNGTTHNNDHTLDLVITRCDEQFVRNLCIHDPDLSDHLAVMGKLLFAKPSFEKKEILFRNLKSIDMETFRRDLSNSDFLNQTGDHDLSGLISSYNHTLKSLLDLHAPIKRRIVTARPSTPWYTMEIASAKRKRRMLERKWRQMRTDTARLLYLDQCKIVNKMVNDAKEVYYASIIDSNQGDQRVLFETINKLLYRKPEIRYPPAPSDFILANRFNTYFAEKIINIRKSFSGSIPQDLHMGCTQELLSFNSVTTDDMADIIKSSKIKCCALDPVCVNIFEQCLPVLLPVLTKFVNLSLDSATIPDSLKMAVITPILKKASLSTDEFKNFRPVSNLPLVSKLIEKTVAIQLKKYIEINCLGETLQSAYKKFHSTETALLKVHNNILTAVDSNRIVILLLLDLSAAFDTVDHAILLHRLEVRFGIKQKALAWFKSYLMNRSQSVSLRGSDSAPRDLLHGVPQGSVLGPLLYLLYTSPLGDIVRQHGLDFHLYADDSQIYFSFDASDAALSVSSVEACVSEIYSWMSANKLKLNADKTELLVIGSKFRPRPEIPFVNVGAESIKPSRDARNIGVMFDDTMNFEKQVATICKSAFYHLRNILRIRKYLSVENAKTLIHAFVTCRLDNCNSLLYGLPGYLIHRLQLVQNCAARVVMRRSKYEHIRPILLELHWLPVSQRILFKILLLTYKALNGLAPAYISDLLSRYIPARQLRSSTQFLLKVPTSNLKTYGDRAFSVCAPKLWNSLPLNVRLSSGIASFKSNLKTYLFKQAF